MVSQFRKNILMNNIDKHNQSYCEIDGDLSRGFILLCDHARNDLPDKYGSLGLAKALFHRLQILFCHSSYPILPGYGRAREQLG